MATSRAIQNIVRLALTHVATGKTLRMPLILDKFDWEVSPKFAKTNVYGRMDPIFTYQNTTRSFRAVLKTPGGNDVFTKAQRAVMMGGNYALIGDFDFYTLASPPFGTSTDTTLYKISSDITRRYTPRIADLYKLMYPLYGGFDIAGNVQDITNSGVGFLSAPPLLRINLGGITESRNLLFVPETFKVSSLVDASSTSIEVNGVSANAGGYTITLGGTVLHEKNRVGMYWSGNKVVFGQGRDFPFNTDGRAGLFGTGEAGKDTAPPEDPAPPSPPAEEGGGKLGGDTDEKEKEKKAEEKPEEKPEAKTKKKKEDCPRGKRWSHRRERCVPDKKKKASSPDPEGPAATLDLKAIEKCTDGPGKEREFGKTAGGQDCESWDTDCWAGLTKDDEDLLGSRGEIDRPLWDQSGTPVDPSVLGPPLGDPAVAPVVPAPAPTGQVPAPAPTTPKAKSDATKDETPDPNLGAVL